MRAEDRFEAELRDLLEGLRGLRVLPVKVRRRIAAVLIAHLAERLLLN